MNLSWIVRTVLTVCMLDRSVQIQDDSGIDNITMEAILDEVRTFLVEFNSGLEKNNHQEAVTEFTYLTDITPQHSQQLLAVQVTNTEWMKSQVLTAKNILRMVPDIESWSPYMYRMLMLITQGTSISDDDRVNQRISELTMTLQDMYSTATVNGYHVGDLEQTIETGSYQEKLRVWEAWHDEVGGKIRPLYIELVQELNKAARDSGYSNAGESWRIADFGYETHNVKEMVNQLYEDILPLYKQLHAYVRRKLHDKYGDMIDLRGPIPAHLLGNMWAQEWSNIDADVTPYPAAMTLDVTPELQKQNYTPKRMFETAEDFFMSIGLSPMTDIFWENSMLTRPLDREVECHASATDGFSKGDFRIKMCAHVDMGDFSTVHHEMGHVEYFMAYAHLPPIFRSGANSAFHEAIGDTIGLSVKTPAHLQRIGLLPDTHTQVTQDKLTDVDMNYLLKEALAKIAFLPYGYLLDQYRWKVFEGDISMDQLNSHWWKMRQSLQGISSPVERTEDHFDAGAKYHIAASVPYIRYFISHIAQFQFYSVMCEASGHKGFIHNCDFYGSKPAGSLLKSMLSLGQSKPWPEAMQKMTGQSTFTAKPMLRYFEPLLKWLEIQNKNEHIGW